MKRIAILSASVGAGHTRAAEAIAAAARQRFPQADVQHRDVLEFTPAAFRALYRSSTIAMFQHAPELWMFLYRRSNLSTRRSFSDDLHAATGRLVSDSLARWLDEYDADVICHTHFLAPEIVAHLRKTRRLRATHAVVITDYEPHRIWLCSDMQRYFVPREDNRVYLETAGVSAERVRVTGIPIDPIFAEAPDLASLRRKHDVSEGVPLLLVLCGGFGIGPIENLAGRLLETVRGAQMVVSGGNNSALNEKLQRLARGARIPCRVLGYTREMHEWMALADLLISKPGGLTTSEALARGLPMVVANAIPGQEAANATMLYEGGAAISGESPHTVAHRVAQLLAAPDRLAKMREAALRMARPDAARDIARELELLGGNGNAPIPTSVAAAEESLATGALR